MYIHPIKCSIFFNFAQIVQFCWSAALRSLLQSPKTGNRKICVAQTKGASYWLPVFRAGLWLVQIRPASLIGHIQALCALIGLRTTFFLERQLSLAKLLEVRGYIPTHRRSTYITQGLSLKSFMLFHGSNICFTKQIEYNRRNLVFSFEASLWVFSCINTTREL